MVVARNEAAFIPDCLDALLNQTYPHNRDTQDEPQAKILRLLYTEASTKEVPLSGKQVVLDLGIRICSQGEIFLTTDADCVVPPTWISEVIREFRPDVGMVTGCSILTPTKPIESKRNFWKRFLLNL